MQKGILIMKDTAFQILDILTGKGKTAAEMTHALKELGGGDMQNGLSLIGEYFTEKSATALTDGRIQGGLVVGAASLVIGGIVFAVSRVKEKKVLEMEGEYILNTIKNAKSTPEDEEEIDQDLYTT